MQRVNLLYMLSVTPWIRKRGPRPPAKDVGGRDVADEQIQGLTIHARISRTQRGGARKVAADSAGGPNCKQRRETLGGCNVLAAVLAAGG